MKPEQLFWQSMKTVLPGYTQRIETIGEGTPDVYGCYRGVSYWVELKVEIPMVGILLRTKQYAWAKMLETHGCKVFLLAKIPEGFSVIQSKALEIQPYGTAGKYVKVLNYEKYPYLQKDKHDLRVTLQNILFT